MQDWITHPGEFSVKLWLKFQAHSTEAAISQHHSRGIQSCDHFVHMWWQGRTTVRRSYAGFSIMRKWKDSSESTVRVLEGNTALRHTHQSEVLVPARFLEWVLAWGGDNVEHWSAPEVGASADGPARGKRCSTAQWHMLTTKSCNSVSHFYCPRFWACDIWSRVDLQHFNEVLLYLWCLHASL